MIGRRVTSNLVFSSDGGRIFILSRGGDLLSAEVPRRADGPVDLETVRRAADGAVIAAGWIEDRLATIAIVAGDLEISHGDYGIDIGPSRPARASLEGSGLRLTPGLRLDPYVRWWQEVVREEGLVGALTLIRDDEDRLFAVHAWRAETRMLELIGEQVTRLLPVDDHHHSAFVGRSPLRRPESRGWFRRRAGNRAELRRQTAIWYLNRRAFDAAVAGHSFPGDGPFRAFGSCASGPGGTLGTDIDDYGLWAVEQRPGVWTMVTRTGCVEVPIEPHDEVIGIVGRGAGGEASVVLHQTDAGVLSLLNHRGRRAALRLPPSVAEIAVSPVEPLVAYLADDTLSFARLDVI
jgi:hypothetical protein